MGRVIVAQFVTLDGVTEDPDGSEGTPFGGWAFRHGREAVAGDKFDYGPLLQTGTFLFGRRTWEYFATLWPGRTDPFANALNAADKAVTCHCQLDMGRWRNSRIVDGNLGDWVRDTASTRDVVVVGSASVVSELQDADLVDEYRLRLFPTVAGAGRRLFEGTQHLRLDSARQVGPSALLVFSRER